MDVLITMAKVCIQGIASAILLPGTNIGFVLFLLIAYMQYRKDAGLQEAVYGKVRVPFWSLLINSVLFGIAAGIIISIPMTLLGITFSMDMGIQYLILLSVLLMLIEPRFLCFSYSGGIISLVSLIFGLKNIDVTGIMLLVGLLHLLESMLIFADGYMGAIPVIMQRDDGSTAGGFRLQRFWPIPIAIIVFGGFSASGGGTTIPTPDWWPLLSPSIDPSRIKEALFMVMPLAAILGYSDFTSSCLPKAKCRKSSVRLALFSILLLVLAVISSHIYIFKYIAAVFAPVAHELLILYERKLEIAGKQLFAPADRGIKVLDTIPEGPAEKMGIKPGDTIMSINNWPVNREDDIRNFFREYINYIWVEVLGIDGETRTCEYRDYRDGIETLGILPAGADAGGMVILRERKSIFKRIFSRCHI